MKGEHRAADRRLWCADMWSYGTQAAFNRWGTAHRGAHSSRTSPTPTTVPATQAPRHRRRSPHARAWPIPAVDGRGVDDASRPHRAPTTRRGPMARRRPRGLPRDVRHARPLRRRTSPANSPPAAWRRPSEGHEHGRRRGGALRRPARRAAGKGGGGDPLSSHAGGSEDHDVRRTKVGGSHHRAAGQGCSPASRPPRPSARTRRPRVAGGVALARAPRRTRAGEDDASRPPSAPTVRARRPRTTPRPRAASPRRSRAGSGPQRRSRSPTSVVVS